METMMRAGQITAIIGAVTLSAVLGSTTYYVISHQTADAFAQCRSGTVVGGQIGGALALHDAKGVAVTEKDVLAGAALMYFGYANCPDVCPVDNARNDEAADLLAKQGLGLTPVFISVDPTRDTPEVLADYQGAFSHLRAYSGTEAEIAAAAKAWKVYYQVPADKSPGYSVDHTTMTYLMLPGLGFVDVFQREDSADDIAARAACYLKAS
jgi:protein SCO1/2